MVQKISEAALYVVKIESGNDLLQGIEKEITNLGITSGIIICGIGSVSRTHTHVVKTTNLPPGNIFTRKSGPYDVDSMNGYIIDGAVHIHIVFSDHDKCFGGHLEQGTEVLTFCVVTVMDTSTVSLHALDHFIGKVL